jgi:uncharacterized membrane protein
VNSISREQSERFDDEKIVAAIRDAELRTSGEIRVYISDATIEDPVTAAQQHFLRMGMTSTRERNGVLIFVAPNSKKFAVIGDQAVHDKCGDAFWTKLTEEMTPMFASSSPTDAIVHAVKTAGGLLAEHFPRAADDKNELSDEVERGQ